MSFLAYKTKLKLNMKKDRDLNASLNLQSIVAGSVTLRSVDGVLPTVPCEADSKLQSSLSSFG